MEQEKLMILNWYADDREEIDDESQVSSDDFDDPPKYYHIYLFGVNSKGKSICIDVTQFRPYFYVKLDQHWTKSKIKDFVNTCKKHLGKSKKHLVNYEIKQKKDAYGFNRNKVFTFVRLDFNNYRIYKRLKWMIKNKKITKKAYLFNSNIDPMLVFMHTKNILASGWIAIDKKQLESSTVSTCNYTFETKWNNVNPIDINEIPPLKIMSFDIECYSKSGDFPLATNKDDSIIQIGTSFQRITFQPYPRCSKTEVAFTTIW